MRRLFDTLVIACIGAVLAASLAAKGASATDVRVEKGRFIVRTAGGERLRDADLIGAVLTIGGRATAPRRVRIDGIRLDPYDVEGEILLYDLAVQNADGTWALLCAPGPEGLAMGFPVEGLWTAEGAHRRAPGTFTITCTSGASAKCARMGYKPWKRGPQGRSLWDMHQACTRMIRADYCGDGRSWTRRGTLIDVYDRLGIQRPADLPALSFEAAWSKNGALCVRKPRLEERHSLDAIASACPERLAGRLGAACTKDAATDPVSALLFNDS